MSFRYQIKYGRMTRDLSKAKNISTGYFLLRIGNFSHETLLDLSDKDSEIIWVKFVSMQFTEPCQIYLMYNVLLDYVLNTKIIL